MKLHLLPLGLLLAEPAFAQLKPERPDPAVLQQPAKPLSPREQALLERIRTSGYPKWRTYGGVSYNWSAWKLHVNGSRTTDVRREPADGPPILETQVAVSCSTLQVAFSGVVAPLWTPWRRPRLGEDEMVAALCANVTTPAATPLPTVKAKP